MQCGNKLGWSIPCKISVRAAKMMIGSISLLVQVRFCPVLAWNGKWNTCNYWPMWGRNTKIKVDILFPYRHPYQLLNHSCWVLAEAVRQKISNKSPQTSILHFGEEQIYARTSLLYLRMWHLKDILDNVMQDGKIFCPSEWFKTWFKLSYISSESWTTGW